MISLVLSLWGYIIYRVVDYRYEGDAQLISDPGIKATGRISPDREENQRIRLDYPDPYPVYSIRSGNSLEKKDKPAMVEEKKVSWPGIDYRGNVKSLGKTLFLICIDGQSVNMEAGQTWEELFLVEGSENKVRFRYRGEEKTISK